MKKMYEKPDVELVYYMPLESIMEQDGNPSITDGGEDWPEESVGE